MFWFNLFKYIKKHKLLFSCFLLFLMLFYFLLPRHLFSTQYSTVVLDRKGELIGARIAVDGQWRFPQDSVVPEKFKQCLLQFEDKYFYRHPGINPVSLARACVLNLKAWKRVSGGSTITMQVIRLYRGNKSRSVFEKILEMAMAVRLECKYSKNKILQLYATHAPFGGNVVGIDAASWRYFGRGPGNLSWAEAALLAVLPNSPAMIHPGRNRQFLLEKRNKLLQKLLSAHLITVETYSLSLLEPLPSRPIPLPDLVPHLTERYKVTDNGKEVHSSINKTIQGNANRMVLDYYNEIKANEIHNLCAIIIEVKTGKVIAYVGNVPHETSHIEEKDVDCIQASRSTGSILKPLLYMAMQQEGLILPGTLMPDIPCRIAGFKPENYDLGYDGAVPAKRALARSLNIPAVRMLQMYGIPKFQNLLEKMGLTTLVFSPDHYGLTLIVGGAEGKLWEITHVYANFARLLNRYATTLPDEGQEKFSFDSGWAGATYLTFDALLEVNRPDEESGWTNLSSSRKIAWKTGTSYGFRDAWAVGTTPEYVVGVWAGNADGEGRPGLTGVGVAAPLMFRLFNSLPPTSWFQKPYDDLERIPVCHLSGYKAGPYCDEVDSVYTARAGVKTGICPYHILVHLSPDRKWRGNSKCMAVEKMHHEHWFVLPPAMEWYYHKKNIFYKQLPPIRKDCADEENMASMELIYPTDVLKIFIPREIDGSPGRTIFEMAHRNADAVLYWHMDDEFLGATRGIHQMALNPVAGKHKLTVVDDKGQMLTRNFEIVDKK